MKAGFAESLSLLAIVLVGTLGCMTARRDGPANTLRTPIKIELTEPGLPRTPVQLQSGQMMEPPQCCPPLELRAANGKVVQRFDVTAGPQRIIAPRGLYLLVGHDPAGEERVVKIIVRN